MAHIYPQGSVYLESACRPRARCIHCQQPQQPFADPAAESPGAFSGGRQTYVHAAARLAWVMAINAARNQDRSGKGLAVEGLANSRAVPKKGWALSTRIQPTRSAICRHAPQNAQGRSVRWCYTTHSPPAVASPPCPAAYAPLLAGLRHCDFTSCPPVRDFSSPHPDQRSRKIDK